MHVELSANIMAYTEEELKKSLETQEYEYGFYTEIDSETFPSGLNEEIIRKISQKKNEPKWMTEWRLESYNSWKEMEEPDWSSLKYAKPDFQKIYETRAAIPRHPRPKWDHSPQCQDRKCL